MCMLKAAGKAVKKRIDANRDSVDAWRQDHAEAMLVMDLDDLLGDMVKQYYAIDRLDSQYTDLVIRNPNRYSEEVDGMLKDLYQEWLSLATSMHEGMVAWAIEQNYQLKSLRQFCDCIANAKIAESQGFESNALTKIGGLMPSSDELRQLVVPMRDWPAQ